MKLLRFFLAGTLLLTAALSLAQSKEGDLVAEIPFPFVVARHTLKPGHYVITHFNDTLGIYDGKKATVFVPTHSVQRPVLASASKMVFHRYGGTYFLAEVWVGSNSTGRALFPSRSERELVEGVREREIAVLRLGK